MRYVLILCATLILGCGGADTLMPASSGSAQTATNSTRLTGSLIGVPIIRTPGQRPPAVNAPPQGSPPAGAAFNALGTLPRGATSEAYAISADGSTVTGASITAGGDRFPFKWRAATGMAALPVTQDWPGGEGHACNRNGDIVGGLGIFFDLLRAQEWVSPGLVTLPDDTVGRVPQIVSGMSRDGTVVVGSSGSGIIGYQAFRFHTGDLAPIALGQLGGTQSQAFGTSGDGSVVTGISTTSDLDFVGFRWSAATGMTALPALNGLPGNYGWAVSGDGTAIAGWSFATTSLIERQFPDQATRWTAAGPLSLGQLAGSTLSSQAYGISSDGSIVVGSASSDDAFLAQTAFVWDATHGMRAAQDRLGSAVPIGWSLLVATAVSDDGKTIAGFGVDPAGAVEAYQATLP